MNPSTTIARRLVAELIDLKIGHVVMAPGSRSAPFAYALCAAADSGLLRLHVRIDERAAGFTALGLAKGNGGPVAVVTTSGSAVGNLHPAVLEAHYAGVPLVVLTADRPASLRATGANQTLVAQYAVLEPDVRRADDVPASATAEDAAAVLRSAVRTARGSTGRADLPPGPVHVNVGFSPPLTPDDPHWAIAPSPEAAVDPATGEAEYRGSEASGVYTGGALELGSGPRTVIVAGDAVDPAVSRAARELGAVTRWPVLAEPTSGARSASTAVAAYRLVLAESELPQRIERVVTFGHPTLNRPTGDLLARTDVDHIVVTPDPRSFGAGVPGASCVPAVRPEPGFEPDDDWAAAWQRAGDRVRSGVAGVLHAEEPAGPSVAADVLGAMGTLDVLVVGSSNPIRDVDLVMEQSGTTVIASRGLSGIDGTVSTASGYALARPESRVRVLIGDLTALHDAGGLLIGPDEATPDLQIIVLNDDGGGIFATLEHGREKFAGMFEKVFGTPHGADFFHLAAAYGLDYEYAGDRSRLRDVLARPVEGRTLIEVPADRSTRRELDERIRAAARAALH